MDNLPLFLKYTKDRADALERGIENPHGLPDTADYLHDETQQIVREQADERAAQDEIIPDSPIHFSEWFFPSLDGDVLSCTGGRVYLGNLYVDVGGTAATLSLPRTYYLYLFTTYENRLLSSRFSVDVGVFHSTSTIEYTMLASVTANQHDGVVERTLRFERMPGNIEILNRWAYYDG